MHERFNDSSRAVSYVVSGLRVDFPGRNLEIVFERRGQTHLYTSDMTHVTRILLECCQRFPLASVYYEPQDPDGNVAEIHCHCLGEKQAACCRSGFPRSRVMISLAKIPELATETPVGAGEATQ